MRADLPFLSFSLWSTGIAVLSLLPAGAAISTGWSDKLEHGLAYAVLAILLKAAFPSPSVLKVWVFCMLFGGLVEVGQFFSPGRQTVFVDMVANGAGAAVGLTLYAVWSIKRRQRQL